MLDGKVALVTGAGRGIGKQIALTLAEKGATVIVNFNGSKEKAQETVQEIEAKGWKAQMYQCDVSDMTSCGEMIAELIKAYGRIDILVNNAGITSVAVLTGETTREEIAASSGNLVPDIVCESIDDVYYAII